MALGLIEVIGLSTAMVALDAAVKSADVTLLGYERVIGVAKQISITLNLSGDVAAVQAAVEAGRLAGEHVGNVISTRVIASPHKDVEKMIGKFERPFLFSEKENVNTEEISESREQAESSK